MNTLSYSINLGKDEEKIAQLLTRDAWLYFSEQISARETFHVKEIPMMPRRGSFELTNDAELIQYYVDNGGNYAAELALLGWEAARIEAAVESFVDTLEQITGIKRGTDMSRVGVVA
jgi:hypothetical protein